MELKEFASAEYIGADGLPWKGGARYKTWNNVNWMQHSGTPLVGTTRKVYIWHKMSVGFAENIPNTCKISWENPKDAWFINNKMMAAGCLIDDI
ncbi:hypothetical protein ADUPG1_005499, partial [Aduncisulcus paluster]